MSNSWLMLAPAAVVLAIVGFWRGWRMDDPDDREQMDREPRRPLYRPGRSLP